MVWKARTGDSERRRNVMEQRMSYSSTGDFERRRNVMEQHMSYSSTLWVTESYV